MLDIFWIIFCAILVLFMQVGFICLETGLVRSKNSINVAIKNLMDFCVAGAVYWLFGFALMFGDSWAGVVGHNYFLFSASNNTFFTAFFLFQLMFCGTAITIVSGAVAERMRFMAYLLIALMMSAILYPVVGHWAWAGSQQNEKWGWLGQLGFIDFAGSTIVHSVGGWCALAAVLVLGPRIGRFEHGKIAGSNLALSVVGVLLLWIGWFGFNGGSALALNQQVPNILLNTLLAALWGGLTGVVLSGVTQKQIHILDGINGVLAGLVAITASCHLVSAIAAMIIGMGGSILTFYGDRLLEKLKIDDAVGAIPVHLFAGIWGTLAFPFFSDPASWSTGLNLAQQFFVQLIGVICIGAYVFICSYFLLRLLNRFYPLRVSVNDEQEGLNIAEHGAMTEIHDLMNAMLAQEKSGNFDQPVTVEPFTESGLIAQQYNKVLARVKQEIGIREEAIKAFQNSESRKDAILDSALDSIVSIDAEGNIQEFNPAAEKCFGVGQEVVWQQNFIELFLPERLRAAFRKSLENEFSEKGQWLLNHRNQTVLLRLHHQEFDAELSITKVADKHNGKKEFTFHIRDITRQLVLQDRLKHLAYYDSLTGLSNRSYFISKLNYEMQRARKQQQGLMLMFLDLDGFKAINDSLGHDIGDQVLCHVTQKLKEIVREDDFICRWGGDEFIILFCGVESRQFITQRAQKIIEEFRAPFEVENERLVIRVSIGIADSKNGQVSADQLIQNADMAMYEAKRLGKNQYCFFYKALKDSSNLRFEYQAALNQALEQQQFFIEYQPKINKSQENTVGFEALLRWRHPEKGMVSPADFIPILEETGQISQVTFWILDTVCHQIQAWQQQGLIVPPVAVNLSGKDFLHPDLYHQVAGCLRRYQLSGDMLELEITESILATNVDICIKQMQKLKKLGIEFSIDDFGTGYSSMSYLKKFPLDKLKIDRSFVSECDTNKEDAAICQAIVSLAQSLGLSVIAEGVELTTQVDFLFESGCHVYQGYLFSRPLSAEAVEQWLA
ncbi:ammonium transporter [methane-oxidizing endosymbiont of Gigantopelta aegis]|uniref:ammonium transporter n=1 Tax=methane-oxidizing endosymbiont of Gigantopelta aegis TaxID=2794938 RepID=UPI0018DBBE5F|nr:ammonium transporter [methane-oxidizing endosymbiont of Gigantopelta aegis]